MQEQSNILIEKLDSEIDKFISKKMEHISEDIRKIEAKMVELSDSIERISLKISDAENIQQNISSNRSQITDQFNKLNEIKFMQDKVVHWARNKKIGSLK